MNAPLRTMFGAMLLVLAGCSGSVVQGEPSPPDAGLEAAEADAADARADADAPSDGVAPDGDGAVGECRVDAADAMVLDVVTAISAPLAQIETVSFGASVAVTLDVGTALGGAWHDMCAFSLQYHAPIYLRIDPATRRVRDVLRSLQGKVLNLYPDTDFVGVAITPSAAIHQVRRSGVCFAHLEAELASALADQSDVLVSESDEEGIVDVRPPL